MNLTLSEKTGVLKREFSNIGYDFNEQITFEQLNNFLSSKVRIKKKKNKLIINNVNL